MGLLGRYMSERDMKLIRSINAELMNDVLQTEVIIYKMVPETTKINIYGESSPESGKFFYPGISITALIERADINAEQDDFGVTRSQNCLFKFLERALQLINFFPEIGDIIEFNARYYEIDNVVQEQFLGNIPEKSFSIICHTHYARLSKIDIIERQT